MKTISEIQANAVQLEALCQGAFELMELVRGEPSPAANALYALLRVLEEKAGAIAQHLDELDAPATHKAKVAA